MIRLKDIRDIVVISKGGIRNAEATGVVSAWAQSAGVATGTGGIYPPWACTLDACFIASAAADGGATGSFQAKMLYDADDDGTVETDLTHLCAPIAAADWRPGSKVWAVSNGNIVYPTQRIGYEVTSAITDAVATVTFSISFILHRVRSSGQGATGVEPNITKWPAEV